jgi:hypothetical protein
MIWAMLGVLILMMIPISLFLFGLTILLVMSRWGGDTESGR